MSKLTKNQKSVADKVEAGKAYTLKEASELVKGITTTKFDASVDVHIRLGVDPRKPDQALRGTVSLPHGTGKSKTVLVFAKGDKLFHGIVMRFEDAFVAVHLIDRPRTDHACIGPPWTAIGRIDFQWSIARKLPVITLGVGQVNHPLCKE